MAKSSIDYSELAGLSIALSRLGCKPNHSNEDVVVLAWLNARVDELRSK